jgi:hypothetical protein
MGRTGVEIAMKKITIDEPNGYLFDSNGNICIRFANWEVGEHEVPDYVDAGRTPEYVDGPGSHQKELHPDYTPQL